MTPGDAQARPGPAVPPWTIIAYLCGDNPQPRRARRAAEGRHPGASGDRITFTSPSQWDLPDGGSERAVLDAARGWKTETLGRVNTGEPETLPRLPAMGVRSVSRPNRSSSSCRAPVCSTRGRRSARRKPTAPPVHGLRRRDGGRRAVAERARPHVPAGAVDASARERIDILALDLRELQCLEVAYELEGTVDFLDRAADTRARLGLELRGGAPGPRRHARPGRARGAAECRPTSPPCWSRPSARPTKPTHHGHLSLSAIDLQTLKNFASAFDTLSLAMMHSVGEELVWEARAAVARKLKPGDPTVRRKADAAATRHQPRQPSRCRRGVSVRPLRAARRNCTRS